MLWMLGIAAIAIAIRYSEKAGYLFAQLIEFAVVGLAVVMAAMTVIGMTASIIAAIVISAFLTYYALLRG